MKQAAHPVYRETVFKDISSDFEILTRTTLQAKDTIKWKDGKDYPMVKIDISSASHPFYTGQERMMDTEGRVEKFMKRMGKKETPKK